MMDTVTITQRHLPPELRGLPCIRAEVAHVIAPGKATPSLEGPIFDRHGNFYCCLTAPNDTYVKKISLDGSISDFFHSDSGMTVGLVFHQDGRCFAADMLRNCIRILSADGKLLEELPLQYEGRKLRPDCMVFDRKGDLLFTDLSGTFRDPIGGVLMGKPASTVTTLFPVKIMMYILTVAYFYGFAIMNGTMQALGDRIIYLFRNHAALLPWGIFLGAVIVGAAGGGGQMAVIVMAPIAFSLAKKANFHPLLAFMATVTGAPLGGTTFWSIGGVATKSIAESSGIDADVASRLVSQQSVTLAICQISFMLIMYFILKGHKVKNVVIDKPAPMEKNQKLTLGLIVGSVALIVLPSLINILFPNPVLRYLTSYVFEIQLLSLIGGMICTFLKLGDGRLVIKEMIPWNMILVICGVGTLIGVASNYGVVQMVAEWVGSNVSGHGLTVIMTALGGILSFVSDGMGVCMPTFYPMIASIASSTGIAIGPMFLGFTTAIWATAAAPLSSSGGIVLSQAPEEVRSKLFVQSLVAALAFTVWVILLAVIGVFNIFG